MSTTSNSSISIFICRRKVDQTACTGASCSNHAYPVDTQRLMLVTDSTTPSAVDPTVTRGRRCLRPSTCWSWYVICSVVRSDSTLAQIQTIRRALTVSIVCLPTAVLFLGMPSTCSAILPTDSRVIVG